MQQLKQFDNYSKTCTVIQFCSNGYFLLQIPLRVQLYQQKQTPVQLYKTVLLPSAAPQKQVLLPMSTDFTTTIIFLVPKALEHIKPKSLKVGCIPVYLLAKLGLESMPLLTLLL